MEVGFAYAPSLDAYNLGPEHPFRPERVSLAIEMMRQHGLITKGALRPIEFGPVTREQLMRVHSPEYVDLVMRASGPGGLWPTQAGIGPGDTPAFPGMHDAAALVCGATVAAMQAVLSGEYSRSFAPAGGLHHAHRDYASGFCVYNDTRIQILNATPPPPGGGAVWDTYVSSLPPRRREPMSAQITLEERYAIQAMKKQKLSIRAIAGELGRAPSTVSRELSRNRRPTGRYSPDVAHSYTVARRKRSRRNTHFSPDEWVLVEHLVSLDWSPEQVSGWLKLHGVMSISHETIYLRIWRDKARGGELWTHLRQATKKRRKRYRSYDSRGRLAGKRHISERPPEVETRETIGHWEIDTVMGDDHGRHSALTLVERKTGYLQIGKLIRHCSADATVRTVELIERQPHLFKTITADNGTEFHGYKLTEEATGVPFFFATPHHSWERGTNENTNGLIRQYLPKRKSMAHIDQADLDAIAAKLNTRPRKRLGFRTPEECYAEAV